MTEHEIAACQRLKTTFDLPGYQLLVRTVAARLYATTGQHYDNRDAQCCSVVDLTLINADIPDCDQDLLRYFERFEQLLGDHLAKSRNVKMR